MERLDVDDGPVFEMLGAQVGGTDRRLTGIASAVFDGRRLLPGPPKPDGIATAVPDRYVASVSRIPASALSPTRLNASPSSGSASFRGPFRVRSAS